MHKKKFLFVLSFTLFFGISFLTASHANAGANHNVTGWAWSDNIGWISFNSNNDCNASTPGVQPCPTDWGVNMEPDGSLEGYAWSENIGWIKFGGLTGFPTGGATMAINAKRESDTGTSIKINGFAKAINGINGSFYDGWISMSGTAGSGSYGVNYNSTSGDITGYAWGGNVIGWIEFAANVDGVRGPVCNPSCGNPQLSVKLNAYEGNGGNQIANGSTITKEYPNVDLMWEIRNNSSSTSCSLTGTGGVSVPNIKNDGTRSLANLTAGSKSYAINCTDGANSANATTGFTVVSPPVTEGFTINGKDQIKINFVGTSGATSSTETYSIDNYPDTFTETIGISSQIVSMPNGIDSSDITVQIVPGSVAYSGGSYPTFNVTVGVAKAFDKKDAVTIKIKGQSSTKYYEKIIKVSPTAFNPGFIEI